MLRDKNDYGIYKLIFSSNISLDQVSFKFEMLHPLSPTPPINFTLIKCTLRSAFFTWIAGLSGKASTNQLSFHVLFHESHSSVKQLNMASALSKLLAIYPESQQGSSQLDGLVPGTHYVFALYARNDKGLNSTISESASCTTVSNKSICLS